MELLRLATAGSVDDGKSTLIGRLLYDAKGIFEDQLEAVERTSAARGDGYTDLALVVDGLRAEREQGITIDVAHRYFTTPRRKFIIADTPGHIQYTRNMVTGASTADLAIILVDARKGLVEQSRRHASLASLLRIPHVVVAVNKMDLVDYDRDVFDGVEAEFTALADKLDLGDVTFIPISALGGDNVVERSPKMDWYEGPTLLEHLEQVPVARRDELSGARFPVQYVIRPQSAEVTDYRGYAGTVAGGVLRPGDEVVALPSGLRTTVEQIATADGPVLEAFAPMSVTVTLSDELDISRGDLLCSPDDRPRPTQDFDARICWLSDATSLTPGRRLAIKHTTRWARAVVADLHHRLDVNTLDADPTATALGLNDIGLVRLRTTSPLFVDPYDRNRTTGSFILVDEVTNSTVGAGMVVRPAS